MRRSRPWLWLVLLGVSMLRIAVPPSSTPAVPVSEAIVRPPRTVGEAADPGQIDIASHAVRSAYPAVWSTPGSAFAARKLPDIPVPKPETAQKAQPAPLVPATPVPVQPTLLPAIQVIGTWQDESGWGVFLASAQSAKLARTGASIGEYTVSNITAQQITLIHAPSKQEVRIAIARPPGA